MRGFAEAIDYVIFFLFYFSSLIDYNDIPLYKPV